MKRLLIATLVVSLSAAVLVDAADDLVISRFSDYLDSLRAQASIPGLAAIVIRAGESNWEKAYGQQDVERSIYARPDTLFHVDGTTQILTAAIVLRCIEDGRFLLDDPIGKFSSRASQPGATIRQLLSHTTAGSDGALSFSYSTERFDMLAPALEACTGSAVRGMFAAFLERLGMADSVPGPDATAVSPPADGISMASSQRFASVIDRLAKPYSIDARGRPTPSQYTARTMTPAGGLISTVRDLARFDAALRQGSVLRGDTLAVAWTPPMDRNGQRLPHGLGWFVQSYAGERIVWQFGVSENAASSMIITVPTRGLTLILLANSHGLARPFSLAAGDVTVSPFARLFLSIFIR